MTKNKKGFTVYITQDELKAIGHGVFCFEEKVKTLKAEYNEYNNEFIDDAENMRKTINKVFEKCIEASSKANYKKTQ